MIHKQNKDGKEYFHYDVHNLYGHSQAIASYEYIINIRYINEDYLISFIFL
jgi:hypothetical protein